MTTIRGRTIHVGLAAGALVLASLAAVTGDAPSTSTSRVGSEVTALELARWIRQGRPHLHVVDVRDADAFESFAIPGAERMSAEDLARARWESEANVVVYSDGGRPPRDAEEALRAAGVRNTYVLRGGVAEWVRTIAAPVLPADPSSEQAAISREIAEMSRWFGGVPRVGEPSSTSADSVRQAIGRIRRRGC
jgi:rhodanese-related sulfurtransferase